MAILVLQKNDNPPVAEDWRRYLANDVLGVVDSEDELGTAERNSENFTLLKVPGRASDYAHLLVDPTAGVIDPSGMARRETKIDVAALEAAKVASKAGAVLDVPAGELTKYEVAAATLDAVKRPSVGGKRDGR